MRPGLIILILFHLSMFSGYGQANVKDSFKLLLSKEKTDTGRIFLLANLSSQYIESKPDTMLSLAIEALTLSRRIGFLKGEATSLNRVAGAFYVTGNYQKAMEITLQAFKINEEINNVDGFHRNFNMMANVYVTQKDYRHALDNYLKAKSFAEKVNNRRSVSIILANIGKTYHKLKYFDSAKLYSQQAYNLAAKINYPREMGAALGTMGDIYRETGQNEPAFESYYTSLPYLEKGENYDDLCYAFIGLAKLFEKTRTPDSSLYFAKQAERIALERKFPHILIEADSFLYVFYRNRHNIDSAFFYLDAVKIASDSLFSREKVKQLQNLGFEEKLRQLEIETQKKEASEKRKRQLLLYSLIGGLVLLSVLFIARLRINFIRKREKENTLHIKQVSELELQSLRAQLNPHFMFNSLNAIQELILLEENEKSQSYLARFAKLLRMLLENAERPHIPLQREIEFLHLYLSLENLRIPDLHHSIIVDPAIDTEQMMIPNMILQPYIENSIWHGLSHKQGDRQLQIRINKEGGYTKYEVEDNGVGRKKSAELKGLYRKEHKSKGMELLSKRFKLLAKEYGSDIETTITDVISNGDVAGTLVIIKVPLSFSGRKEKSFP